MNTNIVLEACVETIDQAMRAEQLGAHRIELCFDLSTGGLTPPDDLLRRVKSLLTIPIMVMVRPKPGNFVYNEIEITAMKRTIDNCKKMEVAGVVFGILTKDHQIDVEKTKELATYAAPLPVTFHKAIDETPDPVNSLQRLKEIPNIRRVLTSGGAPTAMEGMSVLRKMLKEAGKDLIIVAAGKVTKENLPEIHRLIGAKEYHGRKIV